MSKDNGIDVSKAIQRPKRAGVVKPLPITLKNQEGLEAIDRNTPCPYPILKPQADATSANVQAKPKPKLKPKP